VHEDVARLSRVENVDRRGAAAGGRSSASFLAGSAAYVATPALTPAEKMPAPMNMILAARKGYATYHRDIQ